MTKRDDIHKVLIIGSGPIVIGQACEFDYSGTQRTGIGNGYRLTVGENTQGMGFFSSLPAAAGVKLAIDVFQVFFNGFR